MEAAKDRDGDSTPKLSAQRSAKATLQEQSSLLNQIDGATTRRPATYVTASSAARRPEDSLAPPQMPRQTSRIRYDTPQGSLSPADRSASWPAISRNQQFAGFQKRIVSFRRRVDKVTSLRNQVVAQRFELKHAREHYRNQLGFVDSSHEALKRHVESITTVAEYNNMREDMDGPYVRARMDHVGLLDTSNRLQECENFLNDLEFNLAKQDVKLRHATDKILNLLRQLDPGQPETASVSEFAPTTAVASTDILSRSASTSAPSESSNIPEPLSTYHDKSGDVKIMQDRQLQVENEWLDQLQERVRLEDQGLELSETDAAFEQRMQNEKDEAQRNLDEAVKARDDARYMCMYAGIDIEAAKKDASEDAGLTSKTTIENESGGADVPSYFAFEDMDIPEEVLQLGAVDDDSPFVTEVEVKGERPEDSKVFVEQWLESGAGPHHDPPLFERILLSLEFPRPKLQRRSSLPDVTATRDSLPKIKWSDVNQQQPMHHHPSTGEDSGATQHLMDARSRSSSASKISALLTTRASPPNIRQLSDEVSSRQGACGPIKVDLYVLVLSVVEPAVFLAYSFRTPFAIL